MFPRILTVAAGAVTALTLFATPAEASPGPADQVDAPTLESGELTLEGGFAHLISKPIVGDRDFATAELGYDFSDHVRLSVRADLGKAGNEAYVSSTTLAMTYRLDLLAGLKSHLRLGYQHDWRGRDDRVEAAALFRKDLGRIETRLNLLVDQGVGSDKSAAFGYGALAVYRVAPHLQLGVKALGGLGATGGAGRPEANYVGPAAIAKVPVPGPGGGGILVEAAYLVARGVPRGSPSGLWSLIIQWEHVF